jgi:hypothetical protein
LGKGLEVVRHKSWREVGGASGERAVGSRSRDVVGRGFVNERMGRTLGKWIGGDGALHGAIGKGAL